jgi:hypothetical protein
MAIVVFPFFCFIFILFESKSRRTREREKSFVPRRFFRGGAKESSHKTILPGFLQLLIELLVMPRHPGGIVAELGGDAVARAANLGYDWIRFHFIQAFRTARKAGLPKCSSKVTVSSKFPAAITRASKRLVRATETSGDKSGNTRFAIVSICRHVAMFEIQI